MEEWEGEKGEKSRTGFEATILHCITRSRDGRDRPCSNCEAIESAPPPLWLGQMKIPWTIMVCWASHVTNHPDFSSSLGIRFILAKTPRYGWIIRVIAGQVTTEQAGILAWTPASPVHEIRWLFWTQSRAVQFSRFSPVLIDFSRIHRGIVTRNGFPWWRVPTRRTSLRANRRRACTTKLSAWTLFYGMKIGHKMSADTDLC